MKSKSTHKVDDDDAYGPISLSSDLSRKESLDKWLALVHVYLLRLTTLKSVKPFTRYIALRYTLVIVNS